MGEIKENSGRSRKTLVFFLGHVKVVLHFFHIFPGNPNSKARSWGGTVATHVEACWPATRSVTDGIIYANYIVGHI